MAGNDLDNRISAGHAAFLNSSSYTKFGYSSVGGALQEPSDAESVDLPPPAKSNSGEADTNKRQRRGFRNGDVGRSPWKVNRQLH